MSGRNPRVFGVSEPGGLWNFGDFGTSLWHFGVRNFGVSAFGVSAFRRFEASEIDLKLQRPPDFFPLWRSPTHTPEHYLRQITEAGMRSTGRRETGARRGDDVRGTPPLRACSAQPTACRHPVPPVRMPPDAPTFLPVPPYASQYLRVATNLRSPFSEPVNLWMSLTNIHDRPHNLWSSPHHLRSFIVSRRFGDPALRRFGDLAVRRFAATTEQSPKEPWKLRPRPALSHPRPRLRLAMVLMDQTLSREFTTLCPSRMTPVAIQASLRAGSPGLRTPGHAPKAPRRFGDSEVRRFGGSQPPPNHLRNLSPSCISPSNLALKPPAPRLPRGCCRRLSELALESRALNLDPQTRPHDPEGTSGFLGVSGQFRSLGTSALGASAISAFGDSPRRFRRFGGSQPQPDNLRSPQRFGVPGVSSVLVLDAAALRSLGDFGGSQPLMNLRGPWYLGVTMPRRFGASVFRVVGLHPDPPELWPAFRPLRLDLRISKPLGLGLTCLVPPDRFPWLRSGYIVTPGHGDSLPRSLRIPLCPESLRSRIRNSELGDTNCFSRDVPSDKTCNRQLPPPSQPAALPAPARRASRPPARPPATRPPAAATYALDPPLSAP
ncbi:hypothetical protein GGX14DRAFT_406139 [Mycena pura]|uniref:Uncharacterized protein n=1 Tax=Mycena pura TaxID=153505 RepID=A0AAD6UQW4_9AGAR|nr:hypothetical protein GGX14DRAFT_406139 [Mycena pura]